MVLVISVLIRAFSHCDCLTQPARPRLHAEPIFSARSVFAGADRIPAADCGLGALILFRSKRSSRREHPAAFRFARISECHAWHGASASAYSWSVSASITVRVGLIPILGVPQPPFNDEFSYCSQATLSLTAGSPIPRIPCGSISRASTSSSAPPTCRCIHLRKASCLPPANCLVNPWIGQVLVTALMCSALCWMLQAWRASGLGTTWSRAGCAPLGHSQLLDEYLLVCLASRHWPARWCLGPGPVCASVSESRRCAVGGGTGDLSQQPSLRRFCLQPARGRGNAVVARAK